MELGSVFSRRHTHLFFKYLNKITLGMECQVLSNIAVRIGRVD